MNSSTFTVKFKIVWFQCKKGNTKYLTYYIIKCCNIFYIKFLHIGLLYVANLISISINTSISLLFSGFLKDFHTFYIHPIIPLLEVYLPSLFYSKSHLLAQVLCFLGITPVLQLKLVSFFLFLDHPLAKPFIRESDFINLFLIALSCSGG